MTLTQDRKSKDAHFKNDAHSPLPQELRESFEALSYFDEDPALDLILEIEKVETPDTIEVQTSTGEAREYLRYGHIHFPVGEESATLTVYETPHGFFIPFVDALAGKETYGAGRYLDPEVLPDGKLVVNFNLAYNPYCAYNDLYSCPLTPFENRLKVAIRAGEKNFK